MALNPDINISNAPTRIVRRHRRYKVLASGEVVIKGFEVPTLPSYLLSPEQLNEQDPSGTPQRTLTSIARFNQYDELFAPVKRIELCD